METCWVGAIREKSCSSYFKSCSFSFPHILGVNQKFGPNSLNCLPNTAWLCAGKRNLLKGWQFGRKKKEPLWLSPRRLQMSESSFEQQISAIILLLHVLFLRLFSKPAICLHKKDLNIFSPSSRQIHSVKGGKKHSWAAQLKQHQPVLPVTRSVREVGISEAGWLAGPCAFPKESEANINFCCTDFHRCPRRTLLLKRQKQFCLFCLYFFPSAWFLNILNSVVGTIQDLCFMPKWVIMLLLQLSFTFHWLHLDSISQTHHFLLC